jgi:hypothetical protein
MINFLRLKDLIASKNNMESMPARNVNGANSCEKGEMTRNYPSMLHFPEIASKKAYFHRYRALKCLCFANSGEPAAVFGLRNQIKFGFILLPKSIAAGLLFCNLQLEHRMMPIVGARPVLVFPRPKFKNNYDIIFLFLLVTILNYGRSTNSGEPAAVFGLLSQSVTCESSLPKSAAAGLLFFNLELEHRMIPIVGTQPVFFYISL